MDNVGQDERTPFEREIDAASSITTLIDVMKPPSYSAPIERICRSCGDKTIGACPRSSCA